MLKKSRLKQLKSWIFMLTLTFFEFSMMLIFWVKKSTRKFKRLRLIVETLEIDHSYIEIKFFSSIVAAYKILSTVVFKVICYYSNCFCNLTPLFILLSFFTVAYLNEMSPKSLSSNMTGLRLIFCDLMCGLTLTKS